MYKQIAVNFSVLIFLIVFNVASAEQSPIDQLKSFLAKTSSLTAEFKQVTLDENGYPTQTSHGMFYLSRPGKFRWNYNKPYAQEIVSNAGSFMMWI
jgi:outer membrane lipoprotein carrier protein